MARSGKELELSENDVVLEDLACPLSSQVHTIPFVVFNEMNDCSGRSTEQIPLIDTSLIHVCLFFRLHSNWSVDFGLATWMACRNCCGYVTF